MMHTEPNYIANNLNIFILKVGSIDCTWIPILVGGQALRKQFSSRVILSVNTKKNVIIIIFFRQNEFKICMP